MNSWTGSERLALATTVVANLLLAWGLNRMLIAHERVEPQADTSMSLDVVFLPRMPRHAGREQVSRVSTAAVQRAPLRAGTRVTRTEVRAAPGEAPVGTDVDAATLDTRPARSAVVLDLHVPEVSLLPARKPWERASIRPAVANRFAKIWREPASVATVLGVLLPGGLRDPAQLCAEVDRMMQQRGCVPSFSNTTRGGEAED